MAAVKHCAHMKIKSFLAKPFASYIQTKVRRGMMTALADQDNILKNLLKVGRLTDFGVDHRLKDVENHAAFREAVPVRDYEAFRPYIDRIKEGKHNVLWKGDADLFCQNFRHHEWGQIHSDHKGIDPKSYQYGAQRAASLYGRNGQHGIRRWQADLFVGLARAGARCWNSDGPSQRYRQSSYSKIPAVQPVAVV
jgi:hypothetical protein